VTDEEYSHVPLAVAVPSTRRFPFPHNHACGHITDHSVTASPHRRVPVIRATNDLPPASCTSHDRSISAPHRPLVGATVPHRTFFFFTLSYCTIPYHTIPYHTIPYTTFLTCTQCTHQFCRCRSSQRPRSGRSSPSRHRPRSTSAPRASAIAGSSTSAACAPFVCLVRLFPQFC
jgi:hypothetical protein